MMLRKPLVSISLFLAVTAANAGTFFSGQTYQVAAPAAFTGFLDQFPTATPSFGVSAFKFTSAFGGSWGTITRQDGSTQTINYLSTGKADTATFSSFCGTQNCYASSLTDQVAGNNITQATLANMPRVIVNSKGNLAVCATPTSTIGTNAAALKTAKQHLFAVVRQSFGDGNWNQADIPKTTLTANVTISSTALSSMSSQAGLSTATGFGFPGVRDSAGSLPGASTVGQTFLAALPTGTTGTLGFQPGNTSPASSQTGDTLTFTNATMGGAWISNGPATSAFVNSAYWGFGVGTSGSFASTVVLPLNGATGSGGAAQDSAFGQGMRGNWAVYDYDTFTGIYAYNGTSLATRSGPGNITYSTSVPTTFLANASGTENPSNTCFETMLLFPATQASRVTYSAFLQTQSGISFPFAPNTADGFAWQGVYQPLDWRGNTTAYGQFSYGPDALGLTWWPETGGYASPSAALATNINNGATMWRFIDQQGDSDTNINGNERTEINGVGDGSGPGHIAPGDNASIFNQFQFEQYVAQTGSWCYGQQIHMDNGARAPDMLTFSCLNNQVQFFYQNGDEPTPNTINCGAAQTLTQGVNYAWQAEIHWSTNHTSDTLAIWFGTNGGTLTQICSVSGALFNDDTGAYLKQGVYRGDPWGNPGTLIFRSMNYSFSKTANAFSAYRTTQPALPTH